jgi:hypothetical protein
MPLDEEINVGVTADLRRRPVRMINQHFRKHRRQGACGDNRRDTAIECFVLTVSQLGPFRVSMTAR